MDHYINDPAVCNGLDNCPCTLSSSSSSSSSSSLFRFFVVVVVCFAFTVAHLLLLSFFFHAVTLAVFPQNVEFSAHQT